MTIYWSARQIPEIARLSRRERRAVLEAWRGWDEHERGREHTALFICQLLAFVGVSVVLEQYAQMGWFPRTLVALAAAAIPVAILWCRSLGRLAGRADVIIRQTDFRPR